MLERGKVIEINGDRAKVSLPFKEGCSTCGKCTLGKGGKYMRMEADNTAGARAGDDVMVEIPERDPLAAACLLFGIPLLGLLVGGGAGYLIFFLQGADPNAGAGIIGLVTMTAIFILLHRREKRLLKKTGGRIKIEKIIKPDYS